MIFLERAIEHAAGYQVLSEGRKEWKIGLAV
jgi:hypothetical protein